MEEVTSKGLLEILNSKFPDSLPYWEEYWNDSEFGTLIVSALGGFGHYVIAEVGKNDHPELKTIFDYMEWLLTNGDQLIQTAVATGFLEAVDNASFDDEKVKIVLSLLGDECKAYLKAWDDFWRGRGGGSVAVAIREEYKTGLPTGGVFHFTKGQELVRKLEKWLRDHPTARPGDRAAAENVMKDLLDALTPNINEDMTFIDDCAESIGTIFVD